MRFWRRRKSLEDAEWELARRERDADAMLFAQDPDFARELGYTPPAPLGPAQANFYRAMQNMASQQTQQAGARGGLLGGIGGFAAAEYAYRQQAEQERAARQAQEEAIRYAAFHAKYPGIQH